MYIKPIALFSLLLTITLACQSESKKQNDPIRIAKKQTEIDKVKKIVEPEIVPITYKLVSLKDTIHWINQLSEDSLFTFLVLNRIDKGHISSMDSVIIPDDFRVNIDDYCPFPAQVDSLIEVNKILYVSRYAQLFAVYENGKRVKWGPTSTGKESTPTPAGLYSTNWKRKVNVSSINSSWILNWSFNISNGDGISLHEYELPGKPASHACARLYAKDAEWIYYWADQWMLNDEQKIIAFGTPVIFFNEFPFSGRKPWWLLAENPNALTISANQLFLETKSFYESIMARQKTLIWEQKKKKDRENKGSDVV